MLIKTATVFLETKDYPRKKKKAARKKIAELVNYLTTVEMFYIYIIENLDE